MAWSKRELQRCYAASISSSAPSAKVSNVPSLHRHKRDILNVAIFLSYKAYNGGDDVDDGDDGRRTRHHAVGGAKTTTSQAEGKQGMQAAPGAAGVVHLGVNFCGRCCLFGTLSSHSNYAFAEEGARTPSRTLHGGHPSKFFRGARMVASSRPTTAEVRPAPRQLPRKKYFCSRRALAKPPGTHQCLEDDTAI